MANLAIYDKNFGDEDRKITSLYLWDYIYRKNLSMRIGIIFGYLVVIGLYYSYKLFIKNADLFSLFTKSELIKMGIILLVLLAVYSVIGIFIHKKRYMEAETRMEIYEKMISKLNGIETNADDSRLDIAKNARSQGMRRIHDDMDKKHGKERESLRETDGGRNKSHGETHSKHENVPKETSGRVDAGSKLRRTESHEEAVPARRNDFHAQGGNAPLNNRGLQKASSPDLKNIKNSDSAASGRFEPLKNNSHTNTHPPKTSGGTTAGAADTGRGPKSG